jgi:RNA 2',3'-cyclic 3'-phosphodiesterase
MQQLTFTGMERVPPIQKPPPRHRFFFGILLPPSVGSHVADIAQSVRSEYELFGRPLDRQRLHITLQWLGDYAVFPPGLFAFAHTIMDDLHFSPFAANFDLISSLRGRSREPRRCAIALRDSHGGCDFQQLKRTLVNRIEQALLKRMPARMRSFTPHITLLYDEQDVAAEPVTPVRWPVTEIALVHSHINRGRLQPYSSLGRWRLV